MCRLARVFTVNIYSPKPAQKPRTYPHAPHNRLPVCPPGPLRRLWFRQRPGAEGPGTAGTLAAWLLYPDQAPLSDAVFLAFLLAAFLFGIIAAERTRASTGGLRSWRHRVGRNGALLADSHAHPTDTCLARRRIRDLPLLRHRQTAPDPLGGSSVSRAGSASWSMTYWPPAIPRLSSP